MQSQHLVVIFESVAFHEKMTCATQTIYDMDPMHHVTVVSICSHFVKCAIWPIPFGCIFQKWWMEAYVMMWSNLPCNINEKLRLKIQMKSEFLTSRSNSFKMRSSWTWIFKNGRVAKYNRSHLNIVVVLTYQVEIKWNQKSPLHLKISGCLHHVPWGMKYSSRFIDYGGFIHTIIKQNTGDFMTALYHIIS